MAEESFQEKTEQATPWRKRKAREEGQVAKSTEINSVFVLLAGIAGLYFGGSSILAQVTATMRAVFREIPFVELATVNIRDYLVAGIKMISGILFPICGTIVAVALLINFVQVGGVTFATQPITPKLSKIDPVSGFKRLFSRKAFFELLKSILKISIVGVIAYTTFKGELNGYFLLMNQNIGQILSFITTMTFRLSLRVTLALLVLAILDYGFQRWEYERSLRMTRQEVKDEFRQTEGDPLVRARVRSVRREMARQRMMQEVPEAQVVITNPVHLAVALKYDVLTMAAPVVVAKGARLIAERIKEIAQEHNIPIVEDKTLAQMLYKTTELGEEIPVELYKAVAEILAYVYRLKEA